VYGLCWCLIECMDRCVYGGACIGMYVCMHASSCVCMLGVCRCMNITLQVTQVLVCLDEKAPLLRPVHKYHRRLRLIQLT
jgi:hypothetical protein